jgi:hypothetical protein
MVGMSSPQVIDAEKLARAEEIARASAKHEKDTAIVMDSTAKAEAVARPFDGDIDMTDAVAQAGRTLERRIIETRLKQLNPNLRFERSIRYPNIQGIYLGSQFITGMEWERSPEWTVKFIGTNELTGQQEMLNEVRGWRHVIDTLIRKKFIPAEATYKLFQCFTGQQRANWSALHN